MFVLLFPAPLCPMHTHLTDALELEIVNITQHTIIACSYTASFRHNKVASETNIDYQFLPVARSRTSDICERT